MRSFITFAFLVATSTFVMASPEDMYLPDGAVFAYFCKAQKGTFAKACESSSKEQGWSGEFTSWCDMKDAAQSIITVNCIVGPDNADSTAQVIEDNNWKPAPEAPGSRR
ncbi:hypothetical protein P7C70_g3288, partial [Phenoliferia sp. Uapishka_3]